MANPFEKLFTVLEHLTENFNVFNAGFSKETAKQYLSDAKDELGKLFKADEAIVVTDAENAVEHHNDANTEQGNVPPEAVQ